MDLHADATFLPALAAPRPKLRALALRCLGLRALSDGAQAAKLWPLFVKALAHDQLPVQLAALGACASLLPPPLSERSRKCLGSVLQALVPTSSSSTPPPPSSRPPPRPSRRPPARRCRPPRTAAPVRSSTSSGRRSARATRSSPPLRRSPPAASCTPAPRRPRARSRHDLGTISARSRLSSAQLGSAWLSLAQLGSSRAHRPRRLLRAGRAPAGLLLPGGAT